MANARGEFRPGFNARNLWSMQTFYPAFPILNALRSESGWTHHRLLLQVEDAQARQWYADEAISQNWSSRTLERQLGTLYVERMLVGRLNPVDFRTSGLPEFGTSGLPDFGTSGHQDFRASGLRDFRTAS